MTAFTVCAVGVLVARIGPAEACRACERRAPLATGHDKTQTCDERSTGGADTMIAGGARL